MISVCNINCIIMMSYSYHLSKGVALEKKNKQKEGPFHGKIPS